MHTEHTDVIDHTLTFGTTGQGKSAIIQAEATRLGISYATLMRRLEPADAQKEERRMHVEYENQIRSKRMEAVRAAYWQNTPDESNDLHNLHDALVDVGIAHPTREQIKVVFMMLPVAIFGLALTWGFSDTEVGDHIYGFVNKNKETILNAIGGTHE